MLSKVEQSRRDYARHRDKRKARKLAYYHENKEACAARWLRWYEANKGFRKLSHALGITIPEARKLVDLNIRRTHASDIQINQ